MDKIRFKDRVSIKFNFVVIISILVLFIILGVVLFNEVKNRNIFIYKNFQADVIKGIANNIADWRNDKIQDMKLLAKNDIIKNALLDPEKPNNLKYAHELLNSIANNYPFFADIILIPLNTVKNLSIKLYNKTYNVTKGDVIVSGRYENLMGINFLNNRFIKEILNGKKYYVDEAYYSYATNKPMQSISVAVYDDSDKLIGAIEAGIYLTYFSTTYVEGFNFNKSKYIFIVDERGRIISHPDESFVFNEDVSEEISRITKNIIDGKKYFIDNFRGVKKHYFVSPVPTNKDYVRDKWYVAMTIPHKDIVASAYTSLGIIIISCFMLLATIMVGINSVFKYFVNKPLATITESLKSVFENENENEYNFTNRLPVKSKDEFSLLANYYNRFIDTIAHIIREVKDLSNTISSMAIQIASSMEQTSRTTEEQTSTLAEVASTVEELSASGNAIRDIIENNKKDVTEARDKTYEGSNNLQSVNKLIDYVRENSNNLANPTLPTLCSKINI